MLLSNKSTKRRLLFLTKKNSFKLPSLLLPEDMKNDNNYISLGNLCKWLAVQAEGLGVDIFPGFTAKEIIYDNNDNVIGILGVKKELPKMEKNQIYMNRQCFKS